MHFATSSCAAHLVSLALPGSVASACASFGPAPCASSCGPVRSAVDAIDIELGFPLLVPFPFDTCLPFPGAGDLDLYILGAVLPTCVVTDCAPLPSLFRSFHQYPREDLFHFHGLRRFRLLFLSFRTFLFSFFRRAWSRFVFCWLVFSPPLRDVPDP